VTTEPLLAATVLDRPLRERPDAEAVVARRGRLTYRQLDGWAGRCRQALQAVGVGPGVHLAVSLPNDLPIVGLFHAAMRLGAVWVGINRQLAPPEKAYILGDAEVSVFLGDADMVAQVASAPDLAALRSVTVDDTAGSEWSDLLAADEDGPTASPDPLAPAAIAYTSGTSGHPKGAVHSQHNLMLPGAVVVADRGYGPSLRKADCFPLTILNLQVLSTLLVPQAGGAAVVMDRVDPVGIAEWLRTERPTLWNGAPAMLYGLAASDDVVADDLASLEEIWTGGSHCPAVTHERFTAKFGKAARTSYGLTEAPTLVSMLPNGAPVEVDQSGVALPSLEVGIVDEDDRPVPPGTVGEIVVGPATEGPWAGAYRLMLGYWHRPEATEAALRGGRLHTGDLGSLDGRGYLHVEDRQSSLILRGGANVYPAEVERVIDEMPGVAASCVLGLADERLGERVVAVVELDPGVEVAATTIDEHCRANLARYKVPERFIFEVLPRNSMGKVVRPDVAKSLGPVELA